MGYKTEKKIPSIILSVFIVLLILVGTIVPAYAAPTQDMMVTDSGEMLSDREEQEVSEMLYSINRQTGIEYLVYTIKSLNGEDIETCANRLFRTAGLGDKEKDNGLLLLISYDDRKFRLEVGYGLEGDIPDTQAALFAQVKKLFPASMTLRRSTRKLLLCGAVKTSCPRQKLPSRATKRSSSNAVIAEKNSKPKSNMLSML